jgi:proline iminopeptidase
MTTIRSTRLHSDGTPHTRTVDERPGGPETLHRPGSRPASSEPNGKLRRVLRLAWERRLVGAGLAAAVAVVGGLIAGWWTPRGPITSGEVLATMALSLLVGAVAGVLFRSRWTLLLAPVTFVSVYELVRLGAEGPTVDAIRPFSTYGFMAFAVGRGFHGLVALVPMAFGAVLGAALARRMQGAAAAAAQLGWRKLAWYGRRGATVLLALGLVVLAAGIARPATTDPILGPDGEPLAGSIAELTRVEIGGHDLAMMIRGHSVDDPVLLFLAGGPGGSELGAFRRHAITLEEDFVVVTFDQRGTGKSYDQLEPTSTLTLDNAVTDVLEVTRYLRERFDEDQIYLVGQSWGTTLAVLAVQREPELFRAFVGVGQMVSQRETDRIFYEDTLAWARETGTTGLVDSLTELGPPPYENVLGYETALSYEQEVYPYDHSRNSEGEGGFSENLFVEEYSLAEQVHTLGAFMDVFTILYPQLQGIDFRVDATRLDVPVYLVQGRYEARGRSELAEEWFEMLEAPDKEMIVFDTSGHRPLFEEPERFHQVMTETVLAETKPAL